MKRFLLQVLVSAAVLVLCTAAVVWIRSRRPADPPILRGETLITPVDWVAVVEEEGLQLVRTYQGVAAPALRYTLVAKVGGTLNFLSGDLDPGSAVRGWEGGAGESSAVANGVAEPAGIPAPQEIARGALVSIDPVEYGLRRQLAEQRHGQAELEAQARAAEVQRNRELHALAVTNRELLERRLSRLQGGLTAEDVRSDAPSFSEQAIEDAVRQVGSARGNEATMRTNLEVALKARATAEATIATRATELELARRQESDSYARSPRDAYVALRFQVAGSAVLPGTPLLELVDLRFLRVRVQVPTEVYALFGSGTRARVLFPAFDAPLSQRDPNDELRWRSAREAQLLLASPLAEMESRSIQVEFLVTNPTGQLAVSTLDGRIPAGAACEVRVELRRLERVIRVAERDIVHVESGPGVFRIVSTSDGRHEAEFVPIALGFYQAGRRIALPASDRTLQGGDRMITSNLDILANGDAVLPRAAAGRVER